MKNINLENPSWIVVGLPLLLCISIIDLHYVDGYLGPRTQQSVVFNYDRIDEVKKQCASVLGSASELKPDDDRLYGIQEELSFVNGDWWQGNSDHPLMPFDNKGNSMTLSNLLDPLKLSSFWITDVDQSHLSKNFVSVSGILLMGMTSGHLLDQKPDKRSHRFEIGPSHSQLSVLLQGIYTETRDNGGERVMCLLGDTMLPSRYPDSADPWEWVKESGFANQPPLLQDDQILLILRYPKTFSLTNRAIRGSMRSLNLKSNLKYFDEVHFSSWLGPSANYKFVSEKIVSKACDSPSNTDTLMSNEIYLYKGLDFCSILERFTHGEAFTILPNWRCDGTDEFCSKLGPFMSNKLINATDGGFKDVTLVLQDVRCKEQTSRGNGKFSKVSAVFRAVDPSEDAYSAAQRTGLNNMSLSAEGVWNSTSGELCMAGCLGLSSDCSSRIDLYIPLLFSIKQRSILMGTISSIEKGNSSYFPLSFERLVQSADMWDLYTAVRPYYKYSKIDQAGSVLEKDEPFSVGTVIKKSLLNYPKLESREGILGSLSYLSEDLTLHIDGYTDPISYPQHPRTNIQLEIISLGPLFGRDWSPQNGTDIKEELPYQSKAEYTEKQLLLNVSAQLTLNRLSERNVSVFFLEGLYDEHVGKMYLIGCRDVRASWKILYGSMDLEAGLDCLVDVVVSYPPTTARWLVSPTASISISSQRPTDDPLYFKPIKLQTFPLMYRRQREDILSRRGVEGILRIASLSVAIACSLSQLFYIRESLDSVPFMSLVMLGVQAVGYCLPLITGAETIFRRLSLESYDSRSYDIEQNQWLQVIDYTVKLLVLVLFLITLRLCQKVWKSRVRLLMRAPLEPHRIPSDKRVLFITSIIHIVGYIIVLVIHSVEISKRPLHSQTIVDGTGNSQTFQVWKTELEEYLGLVQDLFLLPQIIGNLIWQIDCKPLRKLYFIGMTSVRVLPHIYDFIRSPIPNPYFSEDYEFVNPRHDFYSKFGDIAIPVTAVVLAAVVYAQQRWNYQKLRETFKIGDLKLLPMDSRVYARLPSKAVEAELVSGNNKATHSNENDESD